MERIIDGETLNVPEHVAIILDGNGRWAKKRFMPRNYGHMQGAKTVEKMCEVARDLGIKNNMRVRVIGDKTGLSEDIQKSIADVETASAGNTGLNFTIAINYGSRDEMIRAMKKMLADGHTNPDEMSEALFEHYLDTAGMPDPDLVIRTSGEQRVSNFLLWQMAYSEFYFTPVLWPDYNKETMIEAIRAYSKRDRRFGGV